MVGRCETALARAALTIDDLRDLAASDRLTTITGIGPVLAGWIERALSTLILGTLSSGEVVVDRYPSHLHPPVADLLSEALARISAGGRPRIAETVDLGRIVGETSKVRTGPDDEIVFARRPLREGPTRFVRNRDPEPTQLVTVILEAAAEGHGFVCLSAWIGGRAEPEPWDSNATVESVAFWEVHALLWGSEPVVPGTETSIRPW